MGNGPGSSAHNLTGVVLARVVVPLYLLFGAVTKIIDASASQLPLALVKWVGAIDVNLLYVFRLSIAGELMVAGVMILVGRLARPAGLVMLGLYVPVLIGDLVLGASSCGCFGAVKVDPWVTLVVDVGLLVGLWWFGRRNPALAVGRELGVGSVVAAGLVTVAGFMIGFGVGGAAFGGNGAASDLTPNAERSALPANGYHLPDYESWVGTSWGEVPIATWIVGDALEGRGVEYVMFYRKDCEHCHELMEAWFADQPPAPTLAVAVPERGGYPTENVQPFDCAACALAELPSGVDWFLQTPVLARLRDGVVECAAEVTASDPQCLEF